MKMRPGLVSVTFRALAPEAVLRLAAAAQLEGIEWGGDVHVPQGDLAVAGAVGRQTREAGLEVSSYGSYYRAGETQDPAAPPFDAVLDSAQELGAKTIRVWAGRRGSEDVDERGRAAIVEDLRRVDALAGARGCRIALEYHGGTLTDSAGSVRRLLGELADTGVLFYWQPPTGGSVPDCRDALQALPASRLANLHVFAWEREDRKVRRLPLEAHRERWQRYVEAVPAGCSERWALLEFVRDDDPAQLADDAATLRALLGTGGGRREAGRGE